MTIERIETWRTGHDGRIFQTEEGAKQHEKEILKSELLRKSYYDGCIECFEDLMFFLRDHKAHILDYYDKK